MAAWHRHGICLLSKEQKESVSQLFLSCHFTKEEWSAVKRITGGKDRWKGTSLEEAIQNWLRNERD